VTLLAEEARDLDLLTRLEALLPEGRERAIPVQELATRLEVPRREVQAAVAELIERGVPVGSSCGHVAGFFRMRPGDNGDFVAGTAHISRRSAAMFRRVRALERIRQRSFPDRPSLFDPEAPA
jgi:hypothetical protein